MNYRECHGFSCNHVITRCDHFFKPPDKNNDCIRIELSSGRISLGLNYGPRDVMSKRMYVFQVRKF